MGFVLRKNYLTASILLVVLIILAIYVFLTKNQVNTEGSTESNIANSNNAVVIAKALPVKLRIPSLSVQTSFTEPLGLMPNNEIEVPDSYTEVGWYKYGPAPGELGPAVVVGHVDSYKGPAVFFSLGQLVLGDTIEVEREDGSVAIFEVTELERPRQSAFPTAKVYGDIDHAGLRLITCSGIYIKGQQRYTHNLIVYAKLKESKTP
jgi:sortase (surface protein transpeptidase)